MNVCRFCKADKYIRLFPYAARHWAHYPCWFEARAQKFDPTRDLEDQVVALLKDLPAWQIEQFPVPPLADWLEARGVGPRRAMDCLSRALHESTAAERPTVKTGKGDM